MKQPLFLFILFTCLTSCSTRKVTFEYYSRVRNVLYLNNLENEFYIKAEHPEKLKVDITEASIDRENDTTYIIRTNSKSRSQMTISDGKNVKKIWFIKSPVTSPEITLAGINYYESKEIPIKETRKIRSFSSAIKNFSYDLTFLSSELEIIRIDTLNNVRTEKVEVSDNRRFSIFNDAKVGDTFIFHNIKIEVTKGEFVEGKNLVVKIIE